MDRSWNVFELSEALWLNGGGAEKEDAEKLKLRRRLASIIIFVNHLYTAAERIVELPVSPDPRTPAGPCRFKGDEDTILAFHGNNLVWYWTRKSDFWQLYAMRVFWESDVGTTLKSMNFWRKW